MMHVWARRCQQVCLQGWFYARELVTFLFMLQEEKQILWRASAMLLGMALPTVLVGKAIMFAVLCLGMLVGLLATKDESLRATLKLLAGSRVAWLVVALLAAFLPGVAWGINPSFAFEKWLQMLLVAVCSGALFVTLREMPGRHLELLMKVLCISTLLMAAISLLDAVLGDPRLSAALHGPDKATTQYRLNFVSSALAVLLPFVWARLWLKARDGEALAVRIAIPATAFSILAALVCGGRAGWVGLFAALMLFAWLGGRYHSLVLHARHWLYGLGVLLGGLGLYALAYGWDFMWQRASIVGEMGKGRGMLSGRLDVWHSALVHLWDMPVFGIGLMNFRNLPDAADMHPHNWFLQLLLETGLVGTAFFIALMAIVLARFGRFAKGTLYGVAAVSSLTAFLISGLANTSIFNVWWLTYLVFICLVGWRAGWSGDDLKKRRRSSIVVKPTI